MKEMNPVALPKNKMTPEEYLEFERDSEIKHEYFAGEVFDMVGASENHNIITGNAYASLHAQLRKYPCFAYPSDMRVKTPPPILYTYPDITIVCGDRQFERKGVDTLLNPTLLIEVLSPSTENCDRGKKFQHYRTLASLQEYVLIAQDSPRIERYVRQSNDEWLFSDLVGMDAVLELPSIQCHIALIDVYEKVNFEGEQA